MAITAATLLSERWLDEVLIFGSIDNTVGATLTEQFSLPAGIGDVAIMSVLVRMVNIATPPVAAATARGVEVVVIQSGSQSTLDIVGTAEWVAASGDGIAFTGVSAYVDPDALCLWRQNELLNIQTPEMDSNASPTGDLRVFAKCVRVRPIETVGGPIQLVR